MRRVPSCHVSRSGVTRWCPESRTDSTDGRVSGGSTQTTLSPTRSKCAGTHTMPVCGLGEIVDEVRLSDLVAAIQRVTGCSRATAYRAVRDFLNQLKASHQVHYPEASH